MITSNKSLPNPPNRILLQARKIFVAFLRSGVLMVVLRYHYKMIDYQSILEQIYAEMPIGEIVGQQANYIPELAQVNPHKYGIALRLLDGTQYTVGDATEKFSIQSISKVFSFVEVFRACGNKIFERVDVEPSGDPFNSLIQLENENGIPRNPFINAGALVVTDMLLDYYRDPLAEMMRFIKQLTGHDQIFFNEKVAASEKSKEDRNAALCHFMKSFGNIYHPVEEILDLYFKLCAIEMSCSELASSFLTFANDGILPRDGEKILNPSQNKRLNALMLTCGFYDEAGEFAFEVGLPGKSGVGGGIVAVLPEEYSIAVWSPQLNEKGNSKLGMKTLERFTTLTGHSIF